MTTVTGTFTAGPPSQLVSGVPRRVAVVFGTRPEAIKVAPVILALRDDPRFTCLPIVTGQHREMLDQVLELFSITPVADLDVLTPRQSLSGVTSKVLLGLDRVYADLQPDLVVVQGDTTTTMAGALAAFYAQVPVAHLEAGLRTHNRYTPYPEEVNRRITTTLTDLHLPPTLASRANLISEGVDPTTIVTTGNTVIDALVWTVTRPYDNAGSDVLRRLDEDPRRVVLVTTHRRESWGAGLQGIASAVAYLAARFPDVVFVLPMHRNPAVREVLVPTLESLSNVVLTEPAPYDVFARLMARSTLLLTDSGGIQEEGPSLGKPVLVLRETTERPEAVHYGTARLVGTSRETIVDEVTRLLTDEVAYARMAQAINPYGDGHASSRSLSAFARFLGLSGDTMADFDPGPVPQTVPGAAKV